MALLVKVLLTFDQEIVERNELNKRDSSFNSVALKDAIRSESITKITFLLAQVMQGHQDLKEELVNDSLFALSQLIDWNALELFRDFLPFF